MIFGYIDAVTHMPRDERIEAQAEVRATSPKA